MIIKDSEVVDLKTPTGPMLTYIFRPVRETCGLTLPAAGQIETKK